MKHRTLLLATALVAGGVIWIAPPTPIRYGLALVLLWVLPGLAWATLIPRGALQRTESVAVSLGLSFVVTPLVALLASYLPGPITLPLLLVAIWIGIGLPLALSTLNRSQRNPDGTPGVWRSRAEPPAPARPQRRPWLLTVRHTLWREGWAWLVAAVLIAAGLRIVNLGYAEFQGDEAQVMVYAARALEGDDSAVFQHKKAPGELTLTMASWRLTGITNEWMARLPFAWAGILGLVAVFLVGRRLGYPHAGGIATCLLAIDGYLVGLGRIVQYQSIVLALSTLGLLCLLAYHGQGRGNSGRGRSTERGSVPLPPAAAGRDSLVVLGAVFYAGGFLTHYDAALSLPAGLLLVGARLFHSRSWRWRTLRPVVVAALVGVALVSLFYMPFTLSPSIGSTMRYLSGRVGREQRFFNNLWPEFELSAVYNSIYFLVLVLVVLAAQGTATWSRWGRVGSATACALLAAVLFAFIAPKLQGIGSVDLPSRSTWAWIPSALWVGGALLAPGLSLGTRAVWLWMGVPALFYLFFVAEPLTHIHTALPATFTLVGIALVRLGRWLAQRSRILALVARMFGIATYALCAHYTVMVFVDHTPEYRRTFPQSSNPLYWTPYKAIPQRGLFGFPYRAGWSVVGYLVDEGALSGSYNSNEEPMITQVYTRQATRLGCGDTDLYLIAVNVQDEIDVHWDEVQGAYHPAAVVTVSGEPKLTVYAREPVGEPAVYRAEDYGHLSDATMTPDRVAWPPIAEEGTTRQGGYVASEAIIGDFTRLLGYRVDTSHATPGGYVDLTVLWYVLSSTPADYKVFTHLYDGQVMRGQYDGHPVCGTRPTSSWKPGHLIADLYRIPIQADTPLGPIPLTIGMYDVETMQRQSVATLDGQPAGDHVYLTDITIRSR